MMQFDQKLNDLDVLVHRILLNKPIKVFGTDAFGTNYTQPFFSEVMVTANYESPKPIERVYANRDVATYALEFRQLAAGPVGPITIKLDNDKLAGDRNLDFGLRQLFRADHIDDKAWCISPRTAMPGGEARVLLMFFFDHLIL